MRTSSFLQRLALGRQVAGGLSGASAGAARQVRHLLSPSLWPGVAHPGGAEGDSAPLPWRGGAPRAAHKLLLEEIAADGGLFDPPSGCGDRFPGRLAGQGRGACRDAVPLQRRQVRLVHADQDEEGSSWRPRSRTARPGRRSPRRRSPKPMRRPRSRLLRRAEGTQR